MESKYWLIYTTYVRKKSKPFLTEEAMNKWIEENKEDITVIAKTVVLNKL